MKNRKTRDVFWMLLFIVFWLGMLVIAAFALRDGSPARLISGYDSWGNLCGEQNGGAKALPNSTNSGLDLRNRTFLYIHDPSEGETMALCVHRCPDADIACSDCDTDQNCECRTRFDICLDSLDNTYTIANDSKRWDKINNGCPQIGVYASDDLLHIGRCVPTSGSVKERELQCI